MSNRIKTTTAFKAFATKREEERKSAVNTGKWEIRRVTKSGKIGAVYAHYQTKRTEWTRDEAEQEAYRLCELNGDGSFKAIEKQ